MNKEILSEVLNGSGIRSVRLTEPISSHEGFSPGNGSTVWYIKEHSGTELVIKEYPAWVGNNDISWIHEYMRQLAQKGFPLAKAIGEPAQKDGHYYAVYEYAAGLRFNSEGNSHVISIAQNLRRLHDLSRDIKIPGFRNWPTVSGYQPTQNKLVSFDSNNGGKLLESSWKMASNLLQDKNIPIMPIHGDFRRVNIRFDQSGVAKVFDFGNSRNDYLEADLAITLRDVAGNSRISIGDFLKIYRDFGVGKPEVTPEAICASSLILPIQECLYLWKECLQNSSLELENALSKETKHLESQLSALPKTISLYKEIFTY